MEVAAWQGRAAVPAWGVLLLEAARLLQEARQGRLFGGRGGGQCCEVRPIVCEAPDVQLLCAGTGDLEFKIGVAVGGGVGGAVAGVAACCLRRNGRRAAPRRRGGGVVA